MLRITVSDGPFQTGGPISFLLEGRLIGPWVVELEKVWSETRGRFGDRSPIQVELNSVTYISHSGAALLQKMRAAGAQLIGGALWTDSFPEGNEMTRKLKSRTVDQ